MVNKRKKTHHVFAPETTPTSMVAEDFEFDMGRSIVAVEALLGYRFRDIMLLQEALTHSSCTESVSYERLEFLGDAALNQVFTNHLFLAYPDLDPGSLSDLRKANISTEKMARVAVRHHLYGYLRCNVPVLDEMVRKFAGSIREDEAVETVKAPKVLADIVESIAGAVYVDSMFDLNLLWKVFRGLFEPIVTPETLQSNPLTELYELCQKHGKRLDIKPKMKGTKNIVNVYIGGKLFGTGCSEHKELAKLNAAKASLEKLGLNLSDSKLSEPETKEKTSPVECCEVFEEEEKPKEILKVYCRRMRLPQPSYRLERKAERDKHFMCSVSVDTWIGRVIQCGAITTGVKDAENSAARLMLRRLQSMEKGDVVVYMD